MRLALILVMFASGFGLGLQLVMNSRMREAVASPVLGAVVSFTVGGLLLVALMFTGALGGTGNAPDGFKIAPWWAFLGGACGAVYVVASVVALPKIGAAPAVCAAILGQQVASLLFDTFGWMGVPKTPLTPARIVGSVLLFAGVVLLQRK